VAAVICDLRTREIPDALSVCLLALSLLATGFHLHNVGWLDLLLGLCAGFGVGFGLFALGGLGGGDVKLLASLGAVTGLKGVLGVMFYMAVAGALMALAARLCRQREYPYAPAIALGLLVFIARGYLG
jgi:Flp pilus assembly protein protease CpaA